MYVYMLSSYAFGTTNLVIVEAGTGSPAHALLSPSLVLEPELDSADEPGLGQGCGPKRLREFLATS